MLNKLASSLGATKGGVYPNITGTIKIVSENSYSTSCSGVIQQFHDMYSLRSILTNTRPRLSESGNEDDLEMRL